MRVHLAKCTLIQLFNYSVIQLLHIHNYIKTKPHYLISTEMK